MGTFDAISDMQPLRIWTGAVARAVNGSRLTLAVIDLDPDLDVPEHQHENEQVGLVLKGHVTMVIDGHAVNLGPGGTYVIAPNVRHSATTSSDGATVIDVFAPLRADWAGAPRLEPSAGRWP